MSYTLKPTTRIYTAIIMLILMASMIYAAGSSTGGSRSRSSTIPKTVDTATNPDCETYSTVRERVKCRLQFGENKVSTPEPCRGVYNEQTCTELYRDATPCYSFTGKTKDQCLKQKAGFTTKTLIGDSTNTKGVRNYILFLLYDLQERVETAYKDKQITADQASDVIKSIVDAKYTITDNRSKELIKASVAIAKQDYRAVMPK